MKKTKIVQSSSLRINFHSRKWQHWEIRSWQPWQEKFKRNILGTASLETRPFLELMRTTWTRSLKRMEAGSLKNCPRTEFGIWGVLSKLDDFLLNPQVRTQSWTVPGNIPEDRRGKRGTKWGSFPGWSSSWRRILRLSVPSLNQFWLRRSFSQLPLCNIRVELAKHLRRTQRDCSPN